MQESLQASLSWQLSAPLDSQTGHLFYNIIKTDYTVYAYVCSCGKQEFVIASDLQVLNFCCPKCGNEIFHDANFAHKFFDLFLKKYGVYSKAEELFDYLYKYERQYIYDLSDITLLLEFEYKVTQCDNCIISSYETSTAIPKEIDFSRNKISAVPIRLHSLMLYDDGTIKEDYCIPYNYTFMEIIKKNLNEYIKAQDSVFGVTKPCDKSLSYQSLLFFLKHPWLKDYDFYLWDGVVNLPKETLSIQEALLCMFQGKTNKSVKKAIFANYVSQMQEYGSFQTVFMHIIYATIKDSNLIVALLNTNQRFSRISYNDAPFLIDLILFLGNYYSEKQIFRLLLKIESFDNEIIDIIRDFYYIRSEIDRLFAKPKCTWLALHDEIINCAKNERSKHLMDEKILYHQKHEKAIAVVMDYAVKLPYTRGELYEWAEQLHNCLSGYFDAITKGITTVYGFFRGADIAFAVEIVDGKIEQAKSKYNTSLNALESEVLETWYQRFIKKDNL